MAWNRLGIHCRIFINPNDVDPNAGYFEGYFVNNGIGRGQNREDSSLGQESDLDRFSLSLVVSYVNT